MKEWNRQHDWIVERSREERSDITVVLGHRASVAEVAAIRKLSDKYRNMAPAELRSFINSGIFPLGEFWSIQTHRIRKTAEQLKLPIQFQTRSCVTYMPVDRTTSSALLIEDEAESREVAEAMIAAGIPVIDVEV